ncbi:MAG: ribonucleotide-diphosphate reductase subunit alpha, partial [Desulfovibrionales bacterium]|nr:ribonucleotide-diphosphate reductase subunit alpha [Desulfovibrionales bacterium]
MKPSKIPADLIDPVISDNAATVLSKRYLNKGADGQPLEDFKAMFWRVASSIANEEKKYKKSSYKSEELSKIFYEMMTDYKFLPNSPTLMNAGTDLGQLAACFVLPVGDSMEEIFDAIKFAA